MRQRSGEDEVVEEEYEEERKGGELTKDYVNYGPYRNILITIE